MMKSKFYIIFIIFCFFFTVIPVKVDAMHPVLEKLSKRYFKKNKLKKLGKRAQRAAMDIDLEEYTIKFEHDVIGIEPSWMIQEEHFVNHYFNLLSTLVVGEYDINPMTGYPRNSKAFTAHVDVKARDKRAKKNHNIIEAANFVNSRLNFLIQLTYSDDFGNNLRHIRNSLLQEDEVFSNLTDSLTSHFNLLETKYGIKKERTGLYINFDFEDKANIKMYFKFLHKLKEQMDEEQKLYIVVPAEIKKRYGYTFAEIEELMLIADRIVIDATNFDHFVKKKSVPPTNFNKDSDISLLGTLRKYLISPEVESKLPHASRMEYLLSDELMEKRNKIAILLPYYGLEYKISGRKNNRRIEKIGKISLENFFSYEMGKTGSLKYSSGATAKNDSIFAIFELPVEGTRDVRKFYVDNGFTLQNKYFYIKDSLGIDNVGLNALSYYKTKDKIKPMWAVLALTFGKEREKLGWIIASFLMGFIPIGFVFSLYRNWEVRNALAKYGNIWTRFIMFFVLFVFLFLTAANVIPRKGVAIIIALVILGAFFIYIMIKKIMMRSKKYVNIIK